MKGKRFEADIQLLLNPLYRYARRLTLDPQEAQELVQETCLRAYENFDRLRDKSRFRVWLFKIMTNLHRDRRRREPVGGRR